MTKKTSPRWTLMVAEVHCWLFHS